MFNRSIKGYLRDKICILVTHQIQFLQNATKIIVLNNVNKKMFNENNRLYFFLFSSG